MPHKLLKMVEPIVRHGMRELAEGVPVEHVLYEVALMAALVGSGVPAAQAIATIEKHEAELIGAPAGERAERKHWAPGGHWHPGAAMMPWGCGHMGKGMGGKGKGMGKAPWGWDPRMGMGASPWDGMSMSW